MDGSTAIWLGLTLAAPLTLVPEILMLRLMHSRRSAWHPLDVLFVSLLVGQLCLTLVTFGLSAAALTRTAGLWPESEPQRAAALCAALVSFWAAAHTHAAATLTSMAVDRAMTFRWPYKYRVSVRRTQIRYHVTVLAVVSLLVGVATLFANSGGSSNVNVTKQQVEPTTEQLDQLQLQMQMAVDGCQFLPHTLDSRFALFWLCLHGVLFVATLTAGVVVTVTSIVVRCCPTMGLASSGSDMRTLGNTSDGSSATLPLPAAPPPPPRYTPGPVAALRSLSAFEGSASSVSPASNRPNPALMFGEKAPYTNLLHQPHQHGQHELEGGGKSVPVDFAPSSSSTLASGGDGPGNGWNRQRHSTVAAVLIVAYLTHHLPLLVLTTLGTYFDWLLPTGWPYSAMVLASCLLSGLLLMAVLVFIDPLLHEWMVDSLRPSSSRRLRRHRHRHPQLPQRSPVTLSEATTLEQSLTPVKIDDENRYRLSQIYSQEPSESSKFPLTNGSLFVHLMNPAPNDVRANRRPSRMGVSAYDRQQRAMTAAGIPLPVFPEEVKPPLLTFMSRSKILAASSNSVANSTDTLKSGLTLQVEPFYSDPLLSELLTAGNKARRQQSQQSEPIYASLSEALGSFNTLDSRGKGLDGATTEEENNVDDSEDEGSATESAGDDFEFHNIRTSRQTLVAPADTPASSEPSCNLGLEGLKPRARVSRSATYRILCNGLDVKCAKRGDPPLIEEAPSMAASSKSRHGIVTCVTVQVDEGASLQQECLRRSKLLTSLSMNDIDIIGSDEDDCVDAPVRGESTFSLNVDAESPTKSVREASSPVHASHSLIRSSIELTKDHLNDGAGRRIKRLPKQSSQSKSPPQHFRKKSVNRSRAAVLHRFQKRNSDGGNSHVSMTLQKVGSVVSIAALQAAMSQSAGVLDNGDPAAQQQQKTVFVSDYL